VVVLKLLQEAFVAHVELSWTESPAPAMPRSPEWSTIDRWAETVMGASEPCMVIDSLGRVAAVSVSACRLLGFASPAAARGQSLFGGAIALRDFTSDGAALSQDEVQRIPPVVVLTSGLLARGVLRARVGSDTITMDAVSTPLRERDQVIGSLTFFSEV
jgi:hypothetical protein